MDHLHRSFIENTTLLFIASRSVEGAMDVSPRGGQPCVLKIRADGSLLLPDYIGNNRLDTIGNILSHPYVTLLLLNRHKNAYLRIFARAELSESEGDIAAFPADDNRVFSIMVLTPLKMELVQSEAFEKSDFWVDTTYKKRPLDVLEIYANDGQWQAEKGYKPVLRDKPSEGRLVQTGLRAFYGTPSRLVQSKAYNIAGPGFMSYIEHAQFIVLAYEVPTGEIVVDLVGGSPLQLDTIANRQCFTLNVDPSVGAGMPHSASYALLAVEPGVSDNIRFNGVYRETKHHSDSSHKLSLTSEEIYFHCSAAFTRSRIWKDSRKIAWTGKRRFICVERQNETADIVSFILKPDDCAPIGDVVPGQYVTVSLLTDDHKIPRQRCYSVSALIAADQLRITVRRIGNGGVSDLLHDETKIGDKLLLGPPAGHFTLDEASPNPVVLISAGVGITPLMPMVERLAEEQNGRAVWFIHAARSEEHHPFKDILKRFSTKNPAIRLFTAYSRPQVGDSHDHEGRIDVSLIDQQLSVVGADFYICGPLDFMTTLSADLESRGAAPERIKWEAFEQNVRDYVSGVSAAVSGRASCKVTFARSEKSLVWKPEDGTLLDLAMSHNVEVPFSCRTGECQSCVLKLTEGKVDYPIGEAPLLARGKVMLCQALPLGDIIVDG